VDSGAFVTEERIPDSEDQRCLQVRGSLLIPAAST
jgi:hypothetical protein